MSSALNIASTWGLKGHGVFAAHLIASSFPSLSRIVSLLLKAQPPGASLPPTRVQRTDGKGVGTVGRLWW